MELFHAIKERYSYRGAYVQKPIPEEELRQIVQAGLDAPSGKNLETTKFVIINDSDKLTRLRAAFSGQVFIETASAFIATVIDANPQPAPEYPYTFEIEDASAAVQNILLAITALGYASVWLDGVLRYGGRAEKVGDIIGLPPEKKVRILLPVGIALDDGPRKEKQPFADRAWFNTWGAA